MNGINWAALQNFNRGNTGPQTPQPQLPVLSVVFFGECQKRGIDPNQALEKAQMLFKQMFPNK